MENGKSILKGGIRPRRLWADVQSFRGEYREPDGVPIVRIAKQLGDIDKVIYRELEVGCEIRKVIWIG